MVGGGGGRIFGVRLTAHRTMSVAVLDTQERRHLVARLAIRPERLADVTIRGALVAHVSSLHSDSEWVKAYNISVVVREYHFSDIAILQGG